jgi:ABC-type Co2+ transport system permease subunit
MGWEYVGVLTTFVAVLVSELFMVGVASGVAALIAACTVIAAAVAICGSVFPEVGILQDEINIPITSQYLQILFMFLLRRCFF